MRLTPLLAGAALAALAGSTALAQEIGDPAAGEQVFNMCRACHAVGPDAQNRIGPELNGIIGAQPPTNEEYSYSPAFQEFAADHPVWSAETLTPWLSNPTELVPGTKMVFPGIEDETDLVNVIAYLATFDENGESQDPAAALEAAAAQAAEGGAAQ